MQRMMGLVRRCIEDYRMIEPGDRIAVGVSGGKDSLTLLTLLAALREYVPYSYDLTAITIDMGLGGMDFSPVAELCARLNVPYLVKKTEIGPIIFDYRKENNPCSLCAKMRRGALNQALLEQGFSKVALGHHYDDAVETFLMSLLFEGRIGCFEPVTYLDRTGVTQIRPMLYLTEGMVRTFAAEHDLPVVHNQAHEAAGDQGARRRAVKDVPRPQNACIRRDAAPAAAAVGRDAAPARLTETAASARRRQSRAGRKSRRCRPRAR